MHHAVSDLSARIVRLANRAGDPPTEALEAAAAIVGATLASIATGYRDPVVEASMGVREALEPAPEWGLDAAAGGASAVWNATVCGTAAAVCECADFHPGSDLELGPVVATAALATGELAGSRYADVIAAVAAGCEAALRLHAVLGPAHRARGWDPSVTCGAVGGAMAASRILGADEHTARMALSLAATQASGVGAARGSALRPLQHGHAAGVAVESALLARAGLRGPEAPLEGRRGMAQLMTTGADLEAGGDGGWLVTGAVLKPFACAWEFQALLVAAVALRGRIGRVDGLAGVTATVAPATPRSSAAPPRDRFRSQHDLRHCLALCILDGHVSAEQFLRGDVPRPEVADLRGRIRVVRRRGAAGLTARFSGGPVLREARRDDWARDAVARRADVADSVVGRLLHRVGIGDGAGGPTPPIADLPLARIMGAVRGDRGRSDHPAPVWRRRDVGDT